MSATAGWPFEATSCQMRSLDPEYDSAYKDLKHGPGPGFRKYCYESPFATGLTGHSVVNGDLTRQRLSEQERYFGQLSDVEKHWGHFEHEGQLSCAYSSSAGPQASFGAECKSGKIGPQGYCTRAPRGTNRDEVSGFDQSKYIEDRPVAVSRIEYSKAAPALFKTMDEERALERTLSWLLEGQKPRLYLMRLPNFNSGYPEFGQARPVLALPSSCHGGLFQVRALKTFWKTRVDLLAAQGKQSEAQEAQALANRFRYRMVLPWTGNEEPVSVDFDPQGLAAAAYVYEKLRFRS